MIGHIANGASDVAPDVAPDLAPDVAPDLASSVAQCDRMLGDHLAAAVQSFGPPALGVIDLPPLMAAGRLVPAQLRAAATLFWTMNVEGAGIPSFVDALADSIWSGRLALPIEGGGTRLMEYRRGRDDRFTVGERRALYEQLFGPGSGFPGQWTSLIDAVAALGGAPLDVGAGGMTARIAAAALNLGQSLSDRAVGVMGFAGREIVAHVRAALDLLRDPELSRVLGGGGIWSIIRLHAPEVLGRSVDPTPHIDRAQAGLDIIEWIAGHAGALESGVITIGRDDALCSAAERWQAAGGIAGSLPAAIDDVVPAADGRPREAAA